MAIEVRVPEMGEEIDEATISCWHFRVGEMVEADQDLVELATDKATFNIGITDLKGIEEQIELDWNKNKIFFNPGTSTKDLVNSGINDALSLG